MSAPVNAADQGERELFEAWYKADLTGAGFTLMGMFCPASAKNPKWTYDHPWTERSWVAWQASAARRPAAQGQALSDAPKLAHGHRDDWYLMANARRIAQHPIRMIRSMPNWALASELFATGSTSAVRICRDAGIDPEATTVARITGQQPQGANDARTPDAYMHPNAPECLSKAAHSYPGAIPLYRENE